MGSETQAVYDTRRRRVHDRRMGDWTVALVWPRRRFVCRNCGERHLEEHSEFEGKVPGRLARRLVADHRHSQRCRVLLVDETSIRRRYRYMTMVLNGDTSQILAMIEHRSTVALWQAGRVFPGRTGKYSPESPSLAGRCAID